MHAVKKKFQSEKIIVKAITTSTVSLALYKLISVLDVISKLKDLKSKYRKTELLISNAENAHNVSGRLRQINHDFDFVWSICSIIRKDETMPGRTSYEIDMIKGKDAFNQRVEEWLANVEVSADEDELESPGFVRPKSVNSYDGMTDGHAAGDCEGLHQRLASDEVPQDKRLELPGVVRRESANKRSDVADRFAAGDCGLLNGLSDDCGGLQGGKSCVLGQSRSSHSSRANRIRESRLKVRLAQLQLLHEDERQKEQRREKERQLEIAEAELQM